MFLSASHKYHNDNQKYTTNYLEQIRSFMLDKYIDDKSSDRKRELKNTGTCRMGMLDTTIVHRRPENSRKD